MAVVRDAARTKLVVVIDDDPLVLEATTGLIRSWGFRVLSAATYSTALTQLRQDGRRPDLIVCDYRLSETATGIDAIAGLRKEFEIPAVLISADGGSPLCRADTAAYQLLYKPVSPTALRAAFDMAMFQSTYRILQWMKAQ